LEEIDRIDYGRHMRAWEAERIESIEERRMADMSLTKLTEAEKSAIILHDEWVREFDANR